MMQNMMLLPGALMLIGYCYTLTKAHILLARIDRETPVPRKANGAITLSGLVNWSASRFNNMQPQVNRSIKLFKISNGIAALFIAMICVCAVIRTHQSHGTRLIIATNLNR